jgi:putative tricarboxylic transport membrane protein
LHGLEAAVQPVNLLYALAGCVVGTLVGVLPGLGSTAAIGILLPLTFGREPTTAIIMLAAIYWGSMYGGTITSVLLNVPGEASSAITCLDGHEMARRGRAGPALSIAAIGSFIGGTVATIGLVAIALPLTALALKFGPAEILGLLLMTLALVTGLSGGSPILGFVSMLLGLVVAMVGIDPGAGIPRFTFGRTELLDGVNFIPVVMGMFGVAEVLLNLGEKSASLIPAPSLKSLLPTSRDLRDSAGPVARGTVVGFLLGLVPGLTGVVASVVSYMVERKVSRTPQRFGKGAIEGVAGPETANNAYATGAIVPLFTLGIPGSPSIAVLMGAFTMNGIVPGPFMFVEHTTLIWTVIASMYIANVILLLLNLPLVPLWLLVLRVPRPILYAFILVFCIIGTYTTRNEPFDVVLMVLFGLLGYAFKIADIPVAPFIVTMILGPLIERTARRTLEMSNGHFGVVLDSPLALSFLVAAIGIVVISSFKFAARFKGSAE